MCTFISLSYAQNTQTYTGVVGRSSQIQVTLFWGSNDTVTGSYFYTNNPQVLYTLQGTNYATGKLDINEIDGTGTKTANIKLSKTTTSDGSIVWSGKMYNTDGREFPITISRK